MTKRWLTKPKEKIYCWQFSYTNILGLFLVSFMLAFNKWNYIHSQMDMVSLEHPSIQDKYSLKIKLRWIHQGMKTKMAGTH